MALSVPKLVLQASEPDLESKLHGKAETVDSTRDAACLMSGMQHFAFAAGVADNVVERVFPVIELCFAVRQDVLGVRNITQRHRQAGVLGAATASKPRGFAPFHGPVVIANEAKQSIAPKYMDRHGLRPRDDDTWTRAVYA